MSLDLKNTLESVETPKCTLYAGHMTSMASVENHLKMLLPVLVPGKYASHAHVLQLEAFERSSS